MAEATGQVISHYRILGKLREGGMGVVYRALDTRLDRQVALKLLPDEAVGDPERKWRFVRIRIPVLVLGGRQDFVHPVDSAQIPLFRILGTPEKDKRHIIFEGGHAPLRVQSLIKDILDWLDRYRGRSRRKAS